MKRYWDLTNKQRSELSRSEVEEFLTVQAMENGATRPKEPEYQAVEEIPSPDLTLYQPKIGYSAQGFAFADPDDAVIVVDNALPITTIYGPGYKSLGYYVSDEVNSVEQIKVYSRGVYRETASVISRNAAATEANESARKLYEESISKYNEVCRLVWEDWYEQRAKAEVCNRIVETFSEYKETCEGRADLAYVFLKKAFSEDDISYAFEWFGMDVPEEVLPEVW